MVQVAQVSKVLVWALNIGGHVAVVVCGHLRVGALHCGQNLGLLSLGHPAEPDGIARHANGNALLQATILTPVSVHSHYGTLLIFAARSVLYLLLN